MSEAVKFLAVRQVTSSSPSRLPRGRGIQSVVAVAAILLGCHSNDSKTHARETNALADLLSSANRNASRWDSPPLSATVEQARPSKEHVIRRVAIDPGHGGVDTGAVGASGLREKDVTLDIAHRVAPVLAHELQIETVVVRDDDSYVPLELRTARANAFHADLLISIHCNSSENSEARGAQTFVLGPTRKEIRAVVEHENGQLPMDENKTTSRWIRESERLADLLQRSTLASLRESDSAIRDQRIKTGRFTILADANMPAILFETAFLSNAHDEARLASPKYRQKLADAVVNAIRAYRDGK